MKNRILIMISALIIVFSLTGCKDNSKNNNSNEKLVLKIEASNNYEKDKSKKAQYLEVYSNGKEKKVQKFIIDKKDIFIVDMDSFESYIENNEVRNKIVKPIKIYDSNNKIIDDEKLKSIVKLCENLKHDLHKINIIKYDNTYYVFVQFNVTMMDDAVLFKYNEKKNSLDKIYKYTSSDYTIENISR